MIEPAIHAFADIHIGDTADFEVVLTRDVVQRFADITGDTNPLHMDEAYAEATQFKGRIPHGMLGASFFSRLIGMHLPGKYALYLSQNIAFKKPLAIGMKLRITGSVIQKIEAAYALKIRTQALDAANSECLIDGEALVKVLA